MGYIIDVTNDSNLTVSSDNNISMEGDNIELSAGTLGTELLNDPNMINPTAHWSAYGNPGLVTLSGETFESKNCCRVSLYTTTYGGMKQSLSLTGKKRYKMTACLRGVDLPTNSLFKLRYNNQDLDTIYYTNSSWLYLKTFFFSESDVSSEIIIYATMTTSGSKSFRVCSVSVKEVIDGDLMVNGKIGIGVFSNLSSRINLPAGNTNTDGIQFGTDTNLYRSGIDTLKTDDSFVSGGCITGNGFTPNFVPALFGIHWNASSVIEYLGGSTQTLPSTITWTCTGKENVVQTILYDASDRPIQIQTQGAGSGRTATETLIWDGDNMINYSISIS